MKRFSMLYVLLARMMQVNHDGFEAFLLRFGKFGCYESETIGRSYTARASDGLNGRYEWSLYTHCDFTRRVNTSSLVYITFD